jgi:hypothetical protein
MKSVKMLLAATALVATAASANAVQIDFGDFVTQTGLRDAASLSYSAGGYTVTATATETSGINSPTGVAAIVRAQGSCGTATCGTPGANEGGLGIVSSNDSNQSIESAGVGEMLLLTFNTAVRITGISFSRVSSDQFGPDTAYFTVDGKLAGQADVDAYGWPAFLPTDFVGTVLGLGAVGNNDEFKVRAVEISPVPVPPALVLLASGLAGLGALARRRNKKA